MLNYTVHTTLIGKLQYNTIPVMLNLINKSQCQLQYRIQNANYKTTPTISRQHPKLQNQYKCQLH